LRITGGLALALFRKRRIKTKNPDTIHTRANQRAITSGLSKEDALQNKALPERAISIAP
jgi:hypothetical protein